MSSGLNHVVSSIKESIFSTITQLANEHKAINLAQGFPDFDGPEWIVRLAQQSLAQGKNQYAPSYGILPLRNAIAGNYQKHYNLSYDPKSEIIVCNGATEALYATIAALVNPDDEVVLFEPFYDSYIAALQVARANVKVVTLHAPEFNYDVSELRAQLSSKTKLLILNNPHNPTGKVWTKEELLEIAELAQEFNFYIISDEVYEYLTFDQQHIPMASLPGLRDRVITISSVGKTLSLTGWKVGWACAPAEIIKTINNVKQFMSFCGAHPLQDALAQALPEIDGYLVQFKNDYRARRDLLVNGLKKMGLQVYNPAGTYFALARIPNDKKDIEYCKELILTKQVATIPTSPFYLKSKQGEQMIRFCFAKKEETLKQALSNLSGEGR